MPSFWVDSCCSKRVWYCDCFWDRYSVLKIETSTWLSHFRTFLQKYFIKSLTNINPTLTYKYELSKLTCSYLVYIYIYILIWSLKSQCSIKKYNRNQIFKEGTKLQNLENGSSTIVSLLPQIITSGGQAYFYLIFNIEKHDCNDINKHKRDGRRWYQKILKIWWPS